MKDYALFYSYKGIGDVLIITFDNSLPATREERIGNIVVVYNKDQIIGYNIYDIKDIIKIKSKGLIYYPSEQFLNVINSMLTNAKLPTLEKKENSGYFIGEIKDVTFVTEEKALISIYDGNKKYFAIVKTDMLEKGNKIVFAKVGTCLNNGTVVKEGNIEGKPLNAHICSNRELGINEDDRILVLEDEDKIGTDFFSLEESL